MNKIGYILPNGEFFNIVENGFKTHFLYEQHLIETNQLEKRKVKHERQLTNLKQWIRCNDGSNVDCEKIVELPIKEITEEQYKALLSFLDYLWFSKKRYVNVGIEQYSRGIRFTKKAIFYKCYDFNDCTSDDIVKEIRIKYRQLKEGVKR